jgi:hypothetical protein
MGFTISQIEKLMGDLENLPEVEQPDKPVSKLKAVEMMQGSIKSCNHVATAWRKFPKF